MFRENMAILPGQPSRKTVIAPISVVEQVSQGQFRLVQPESHPVQPVKPLFTGLTGRGESRSVKAGKAWSRYVFLTAKL